MEILTLVQTKKIVKPLKVLIYDRKYWDQILRIEGLLENFMICEDDLDLFTWCNSVDEMEAELIRFITQVARKPV